MAVAVIAELLGLVAVVVATYGRGAALDPPPDPDPGWDPLPVPSDVARPTFPIAFPGYDPAAVDATVEALASAYEALWSAASAETRERAWRSLARRRGLPHDSVPVAVAAPEGEPGGGSELTPPAVASSRHADDPDHLRAAAALARLEQRTRRTS